MTKQYKTEFKYGNTKLVLVKELTPEQAEAAILNGIKYEAQRTPASAADKAFAVKGETFIRNKVLFNEANNAKIVEAFVKAGFIVESITEREKATEKEQAWKTTVRELSNVADTIGGQTAKDLAKAVKTKLDEAGISIEDARAYAKEKGFKLAE